MDKNLIPKKIHYCWFGRNPLPESAIKCIESWRRFFPDHEIIEWNEDNFDVNTIPYTAEAYSAKKYAFVSDYARFKILYEHGGLYFDTDVEVIKPFDDIIAAGPFMGCERSAEESASAIQMGVAPGLGLGAYPTQPLYKEIIDYYNTIHFLDENDRPSTDTVVTIVSKILCGHGLSHTNVIQVCAGILIYPNDYFSPKNIDTKITTITNNTRSIHHYDATWAEWYDKAAGERGPKLSRLLGNKTGQKINIYIYLFQKYILDKIISIFRK